MAPCQPKSVIGIKLPLQGSALNRLPYYQNMTEVLRGDQIPVFLMESQQVVLFLIHLLIRGGGLSFGFDRA